MNSVSCVLLLLLAVLVVQTETSVSDIIDPQDGGDNDDLRTMSPKTYSLAVSSLYSTRLGPEGSIWLDASVKLSNIQYYEIYIGKIVGNYNSKLI